MKNNRLLLIVVISELPSETEDRKDIAHKNMSDKLKVIISSTARDLPEHRAKIRDACLRKDMFPMMMEHLPALDAEAITASLDLVNDADIYIGVFAHRYGYVAKGSDISITEMEYNRAVERGIPRLIFIMHDDHPVKAADVEKGEGAIKLQSLKERLETERVRDTFASPEELWGKIIHALDKYHERDPTAFHYVSEIPAPPAEFIAHPYTLLQTRRLIGRQSELGLLTDWVAKPESDVYQARILNIVAIGGMGKSALTWNWFKDIAPQEMRPLAGRMWWSFYESDATFENFVTRALAYVTRRPLEDVQQIPAPERESQLLAALNREPFLIVLDGLERVLIAYARMDAARLDDNQVGKEKNLRKTADPRVGRFLKKLAQVKSSRILVSTRLYPAEFETETGDPIPSGFKHELKSLTDEDAVELWRAFNVSGSRDLLLPLFATFDKHPLLIQALAGEIRRYRRAPGNFEEWHKANPKFDPTKFPRLQDAMGHVLEFALRGLNEKARKTLQTIAAFRMPATFDTLTTLLVGKIKKRFDLRTRKLVTEEEEKLFDEETRLIETLTELEDRGLVGWDMRANRYDLHPIVRGIVWGQLNDYKKREVYANMHKHFDALPKTEDWRQVSCLEELTPAIELYNILIGLGRYDEAENILYEQLDDALLYRLSLSRHHFEVLEMLFPDGLEQLPRLNNRMVQARVIHSTGIACHLNGEFSRAIPLFRRASAMELEMKRHINHSVCLNTLSASLLLSGSLYESELQGRKSLIIASVQDESLLEAIYLQFLGLLLITRGFAREAHSALKRTLHIARAQSNRQLESTANYCLARRAIWLSEFDAARLLANQAWELAQIENLEGDFIRAARVQGETALGLNDFGTAEDKLNQALSRSRIVNLVEEELPTLVALAKSSKKQGEEKVAREFLEDVWEAAERGPYPLIHSDACNLLVQIERDAGNPKEAIEAATKAYRLAWSDGPPYAYHWGLVAASKHLEELGAPKPEMPPFDASKFEPMPEVEIDPKDEFHVGETQLDNTPDAI